MGTGVLINVELVRVWRLIGEVVVIGVQGVDAQFVLVRGPPLGIIELVPSDCGLVLHIDGWRTGGTDGPVDCNVFEARALSIWRLAVTFGGDIVVEGFDPIFVATLGLQIIPSSNGLFWEFVVLDSVTRLRRSRHVVGSRS